MSAMSRRYGLFRVSMCIALFVPVGLPRVVGEDPVIPLPKQDRERLEKGLGPGVVGKAIAAPTIEDPATFLNLKGGRSWRFRYTVGEKKGKVENFTLSMRRRASGVTTWKGITGPTTAMTPFLARSSAIGKASST